MSRFAKIDIGAGKSFDVDKLSPEMKTAIEGGMAQARGPRRQMEAAAFASGGVNFKGARND
jgi:hypothetical protein